MSSSSSSPSHMQHPHGRSSFSSSSSFFHLEKLRGSPTIRRNREDACDKRKEQRQLERQRENLLRKEELQKKTTPAVSSYTSERSLDTPSPQRGEEEEEEEERYRKNKRDLEAEWGRGNRLLSDEKRRRRKEEEEEESEKDDDEEEVDHLKLPSIQLHHVLRPSACERYGRRRRREEEGREREGKKDSWRTGVDMREKKFKETRLREKDKTVYLLHDEERHRKTQNIEVNVYNSSRYRTRRTEGGEEEEEGVKYHEFVRAVHTLRRAIERCAEEGYDEEERFHYLFGLERVSE